MSLHRTSHVLRPVLSTRSLFLHPRHASSQQNADKPQPKILSESPPEKGNEPEDVKKHNEEMERRAERAAAQVNDEDVKKDKVDPKFWSGSQAGNKKESP